MTFRGAVGAGNGSGALPIVASVLVDDREPPRIAERLAALGLTVSTTRLPHGDYQTFAHGLNVIIERKTISNLLGSMSDRQIVAQAHGMVDEADLAILLREGAFRRSITQQVEYHDPRHPQADQAGWVRTGWAWSSFQGMMFDLALMGILIWDTLDLGHAPEDIAIIVGSLHQDQHRWIRERQRPNVLTADKTYRNVVWALCAFNGIGPDTAHDLLMGRCYADVIAAASDDPDALTKINGFGKVRAKSLHEEVTTQYG